MGQTLQEMACSLGAWRAWAVALEAREALSRVVCPPDGALVTAPLEGSPIRCVDLRELGRQARAGQVPLLVDARVTGVVGCAACRLGAHVTFVGLGGAGCLLAVSRDAQSVLPGLVGRLDAAPPLDGEAWERMSAQVEQQRRAWHETSDAAQVLASYLRCHPRVAEVCYPGLKGDANFEVAARTLQGGFGPWVDYRLVGEQDWRRIEAAPGDARAQVMEVEAALAIR